MVQYYRDLWARFSEMLAPLTSLVGEFGHNQTDLNTESENRSHHDWTTKLVIKYFLEKMVSSANQKVGVTVILGLSHQFIQMGQSGFNVEQSQKD